MSKRAVDVYTEEIDLNLFVISLLKHMGKELIETSDEYGNIISYELEDAAKDVVFE